MANGNGANIGFEKELWQAADALRSNMDAAEYKHIVLGLLFLKYISDAFEEQYKKLDADRINGADPEDPDEYLAKNVFWVPQDARWAKFQANAKQPTIGKLIDDAMIAIETENPALKGVLPKDYAHPRLDKQRLGQLIDLVSNIGLGNKENRSKDMLGRVYEYFLSEFASAEGKRGGQFYTPQCIVRLLVEMLAPYKGRIFDPACGSGGMFVQSEKFVEAHGGKIGDISIYGQESNHTTWRLAKMNLAIRGIDGNLGKEHADSFHKDMHPDLKADFVLANPPFNDSDWRGDLLKDDKRWKYGTPPTSNANFAWVQHFIHHLAPTGTAGFVLAQVSLSSESQVENEIRKNIVESDLVECIVTLPGKLFFSTPIPVCLWFISRNKRNNRFRDRRGEILFIDASSLGHPENRTHSYLSDEDIQRISSTYWAWKQKDSHYVDIPGFSASVTIQRVRYEGHSLFPATYIDIDKSVLKRISIKNDSTFSALVTKYRSSLDLLYHQVEELTPFFEEIEHSTQPSNPLNMIEVSLNDIFEKSDERLGNRMEPEILTCTERAGLILQRERFAKRVATSDASKYKVVHRTDVVYNPYLLWAGAIDQCWIVEEGITSPAYEVLRIKPGWNPVIIGELIKSPMIMQMYNSISVGTVQRRRRAPVERFLALKVEVPDMVFQDSIKNMTMSITRQLQILKESSSTLQDFLNNMARLWLNDLVKG